MCDHGEWAEIQKYAILSRFKRKTKRNRSWCYDHQGDLKRKPTTTWTSWNPWCSFEIYRRYKTNWNEKVLLIVGETRWPNRPTHSTRQGVSSCDAKLPNSTTLLLTICQSLHQRVQTTRCAFRLLLGSHFLTTLRSWQYAIQGFWWILGNRFKHYPK